MGWEKDINGVVYFWQWLLNTHVIGVVESPTTAYMRDDWEKLSDEKSSLRACRRRIPNRSRVVSCESRIVHHVLLPLPLLFTPITSNSLQEDTQFLLRFEYNICIYNTIQYNILTIWNAATGCLYLSWTFLGEIFFAYTLEIVC